MKVIIAPFPITPQFSPKIVPAVARFRYKTDYPVAFTKAFGAAVAMRTRNRALKKPTARRSLWSRFIEETDEMNRDRRKRRLPTISAISKERKIAPPPH